MPFIGVGLFFCLSFYTSTLLILSPVIWPPHSLLACVFGSFLDRLLGRLLACLLASSLVWLIDLLVDI